MKEKNNVNNEDNKNQNNEVLDKPAKLSELGKEYLTSSVDDELSQKEEILKSNEIGDEEKKKLIKSLDVVEKIMKPTGAEISPKKVTKNDKIVKKTILKEKTPNAKDEKNIKKSEKTIEDTDLVR